jgi:hypothetical protein
LDLSTILLSIPVLFVLCAFVNECSERQRFNRPSEYVVVQFNSIQFNSIQNQVESSSTIAWLSTQPMPLPVQLPSRWDCLLPIAYCLLPIAYCLLPIAYCLLPIAYCLLPIESDIISEQRRSGISRSEFGHCETRVFLVVLSFSDGSFSGSPSRAK